MIRRRAFPYLVVLLAFTFTGCGFLLDSGQSGCPGAFPEHVLLEEGAEYVYDYLMTSGGGQGSGEDRGHGMMVWRVRQAPRCIGAFLSVGVESESSIITEYRSLVGDDQDWHRRDSTFSKRSFRVTYSADEGLSGITHDPIPAKRFETGRDTLVVTTGGAHESKQHTFVRQQGMISKSEWKMAGLGGPSTSETWVLRGVDRE